MSCVRKLFKGFFISLSMFSIIPSPKAWDEDAFSWVIPLLPVIGLIIGALWGLFSLLLLLIPVPLPLRAAALLLFPLIMSGFIHIDGFMDTCDAVFSRAELSKKHEILKDPHAGAFASIAFGVYLLLGYASLCAALERGFSALLFVLIPILSRCIVGIAAYSAKPIFDSGFGASFARSATAPQRLFPLCAAVICVLTGCLLGGAQVILPLSGLVLGGALSAVYAVRQLGGVSGDLYGFIITMSELCAIILLSFA